MPTVNLRIIFRVQIGGFLTREDKGIEIPRVKKSRCAASETDTEEKEVTRRNAEGLLFGYLWGFVPLSLNLKKFLQSKKSVTLLVSRFKCDSEFVTKTSWKIL